MANPYHKIKDKMRYVTGHCPKCQFGKVELYGLIMKCLHCGWIFDPDERAFMKIRNHPNGVFVPGLRRGRPKRVNPQKGKPNGKVYGDELSRKVVEHYRNTADSILQTARIFGMSQTTAGRIIKATEDRAVHPAIT